MKDFILEEQLYGNIYVIDVTKKNMKTKLLRKTGNMTFKVISLDDEKPVGDKDRIKEYIVDLKGTDWCCDCKDYYYRKNICKHIKWVLSQLANKEEIPFEQEGDYDKIIKEVR